MRLILATLIATTSLTLTTLPAAAWPIVTTRETAIVYPRAWGKGSELARIKRGTDVEIDYCTPPHSEWCHVRWDGPDGWVRGSELTGGAKQALVTPFMSVLEPGWEDDAMGMFD
ncbi:MAG: SH3 domain-containing protein [Devosia sp.]